MSDDLAGRWHVGDKCLAPFPENEKLCEATITSLETDENGNSFAVVSFRASQEKKILVAKLCSIKTSKYAQKNLIFDDEDLEKPHFPGRRFPSSAVDYELSKDGDRIPYTINRYLRDYQRKGAQFLYEHSVCGNGCILGDDMGLGKTVQVISFLAAVLHKKGTRADIENNMPEFLRRTMKKEMPSVPKKPFLIVAPLSVLYNWKDELDTWGYFKMIVLHGNRKDYEMSRIKQGKCEVALTTYETLRLCLDDLNSLEWSAVIVDEVHRIKNPKSQITQTMKALKCKVRLGLTGTILQNNMKELWCVMDWAVPGLLGNEARFKKEFSDPVEHGQRHTATKRELATGRKAMQRLAQKMSRYFLRRTKALINDQLPKKEDRMVYCSLTEFQRAVYKTVLETEDVHLVLRAGEPCSCNSGRKRKYCCYKTNAHGETMRALYFSYLMVLRKIANHAALLQTDNTSKQQEAYITRVCSQVFSKFPDFVKLSKDAAFETISDPKYSGKMKVLQKLLNHFRKNKDKVLLFSFSTKLLDVLEQYCMASGLDYRRLDGNTKAEDRVKIVKEFNSMEEVNICLVSTMAGGLGLNFVGANIVILFDPTWNPANDLQAIDRAYRIGQCRDVKVFRLISLGTVEEMMYLRQVYKQQLHCAVVGSENAKRYFEAVQGSKQHQGELFGIHNLFKLQDHGSCLTKEILEREGQVEAGVMTATTWLKEEPQEHAAEMDTEGGCEDQDTASPRKLLKREEFDCGSDFSDEEPVRNSKVKAEQSRSCNTKNSKVLQGQLTLLQCGFPKLLEKGTEIAEGDSCIAVSSGESVGGKSMWQISKESSRNECSLKTEDHRSTAGPRRDLLSPIKAVKQELHRETTGCDYPVSLHPEEEKDPGNKYKDMHILNQVGVVMETECSSSDSDDIIFPSQVPTDQKSVKSYKGAATNCECLGTEKSSTHTSLQKHLTSEHSSRSVSPYRKMTPFENIRKITSVKEASDLSDESDDIEMSGSGKQKFTGILKEKGFCNRGLGTSSARTVLHKKNSSVGENIEEFSSPEDGFPINKRREKLNSERCGIQIKPKSLVYPKSPSLTLRKRNHSDKHQTYFSEQTFESQGKNVGSLDRLLGDVAEVSYVHSNQNVVGSSKAENQMSRWAVQDVFELQQFSQLPANVAVCPAKKSRKSPWEAFSRKKNTKKDNSVKETSKPAVLYIRHPVCQKKKEVHQVGAITFLVGKTPQRIRRKQFEEMASHFQKASVEELAKHIIKTTSEERQKMLKEFYSAKYPELKDLLKVDVPVSVSEGSEEGAVHRTPFRKRKTISKHGKSESESSTDLYGQKRHDAEVKQFQFDPFIQAAVCHDVEDKQLPTVITQDSVSRRNSQAFKDFMASDSLSSKSGIIEGLSANTTKGQPNLKGMESPREPFLSPPESRHAQMCKKNSFADMLGDISILNDLFKSHENRPTEAPRKTLSGPAEKARTRPKDFWDMLNEPNDESLEKLTDVAVIEKLCERASPVTSSKKKEDDEKSLWKKNDNFLWKRYAADTDDKSLSGT
ncbi:DNA excision repair protein ERCC-6-like 2 isoform X1 [Zootoca vivipara]|uniref:DNA excision repair protein ERCC-6-like 2 isoform X1 n=1 Tax=Zootoca vivipara TaxID=8524 RepID=UPI00293BB085|nr:DNA excision repair protein ERCC-6-like 2 isoform X1 [Zootoca vivipara]XP_034955716.2 DNA excision repair protein ERCC-6-like 2 isoform X1 [Zootoca vivipara]XP_060136089.1 DNA excision repair protein ERCC-6-like 2 isoform X1 [Zootoca vivipara]